MLSSAAYDSYYQLLYVVFDNVARGYPGVSPNVINVFTRNPDPEAVYETYVIGTYPSLLLLEKSNCPLQQETGDYLWTQ